MERKALKLQILNEPKLDINVSADTNIWDLVKEKAPTLSNSLADYEIQFESGLLVRDDAMLHTLEEQTLLIVRRKMSTSELIKRVMDNFERLTLANKGEVYEIIRTGFQSGTMGTKTVDYLMAAIQPIQTDAVWRKGMKRTITSKEVKMRNLVDGRIRTHFHTAKAYFRANKTDGSMEVIDHWQVKLTEKKWYNFYFDRSTASAKERFCDETGVFRCEGAYNKDECSHCHSIDPYSNSEILSTFSTWNLDHRIEKATIFTTLKKALDKKPKGSRVHWEYFYDLMFTRVNIKLVHPKCHDKKDHPLKCEESKIYMSIPEQ